MVSVGGRFPEESSLLFLVVTLFLGDVSFLSSGEEWFSKRDDSGGECVLPTERASTFITEGLSTAFNIEFY